MQAAVVAPGLKQNTDRRPVSSSSAPAIVTKLDLPILDYTSPELCGERFHETMRELCSRGWLAAGPFGCIVLDRESIEFFLRSPNVQTPGLPMIEWFDVQDGPLRQQVEQNLLAVEGTDHRRLRALVNPEVSVRAARRYRPIMQRVLADLPAAIAADGSCELVSALAKPFSARVIADILGAPIVDAEKLQQWASLIERQFDVASMACEQDTIDDAVRRAYAYAGELVHKRRREPADDLISRLVDAEGEGDKLSDEELVNLILNLQVGGIDTIQSQLGQMMRLFAEHPKQWRLVRARPDLVPSAVEEVLRYEPMLPFTARVLRDDLVYRGVEFPAGTVVMLCTFTANRELGAGGRDPWAFDVTRSRTEDRLLSFGAGPHYCVGSNLARAGLEEALTALSSRYAAIELDGAPVYGSVTGLYGMLELPVRLRAAGEHDGGRQA